MREQRIGFRLHVTSPTVSRADVGLRSERGPILLAVMLSVGLVAIDATVLATAVPAVVDDLGGFTQFPWLFSIYLLTQAVTVPLYSKLADQYGRKPMMLIGVSVFLLGSLLCGLAWNMALADRLPRGPGHRRRRRAADRHDDRRRHLLGRRAGQGAGLPRRRLGRLVGRRPDAGRRLLRLPVVALDLLHQPPDRRRRALDVRPQLRGAGRADRAQARRPRGRAAQRRRRVAAARAARGRRPLVVVLTDQRRASSSGPRSRSPRSSTSSAGRPSRCSRCGCSGTG